MMMLTLGRSIIVECVKRCMMIMRMNIGEECDLWFHGDCVAITPDDKPVLSNMYKSVLIV